MYYCAGDGRVGGEPSGSLDPVTMPSAFRILDKRSSSPPFIAKELSLLSPELGQPIRRLCPENRKTDQALVRRIGFSSNAPEEALTVDESLRRT